MTTALALLDRLAQKNLQTGGAKATSTSNDHGNFANSLLRVASAKHDQPRDLLVILDRFLDYQIAWSNQRRDNPLVRLAANNLPSRAVGSIGISVGGTLRRVSYSYPAPNAYYDTYAIGTLRTMFEYFKQLDLV